MKKYDICQSAINQLNNNRLKKFFSEHEESYISTYEKGEYLETPFFNHNIFQVVISGIIEIYYVRSNGTRCSLSRGGEGYILGDLSFFHKSEDSVFAEAKSEVICLSINVEEIESQLKNDATFLYLLAESLAHKMQTLTNVEASTSTLEERVLMYMQYKCQNGEMKGIEQNAFRLHCSARQLQRILNKYENDGIIEKIGKGSYKLKKNGVSNRYV